MVWTIQGALSYTLDPTLNLATVTWGAPGSGSISVFTQNTLCPGEDALCVTVIEAPEALFSTTPTSTTTDTVQICKGQTVWFQNNSLYADSYEWFFGDGSAPVGTVNPQHTYNNPGIYTITLIARSACLCSDTTRMWVEVIAADAPLLDCVGTVCPGTTVTYTTSAACSDFVWNVGPNGSVLSGGGNADNSITIQWNAGPSGQISLLAQNCSGTACPTPAQTQVPVIDDNAEIQGPERVCPDAETVYSIEPYQGTGFVWSLSGGGMIAEGQGTNSVVVRWSSIPNPNTVRWLTVAYDNCYLGCGGQDSIPVRILSPFVVNGPVELCENGSGTFNALLSYNAQGINCNWTVFDPSGNSYFNNTGNNTMPSFNQGSGIYRLFATPVDPLQTCTNQADWAVSIPAAPAGPTGISGNSNFCPGNPVTYTALGLSPSANVRWMVNNGPGPATLMLGNPIVVNWGAAAPWELQTEVISSNGLGCSSAPVSLVAQPLSPLTVNFMGADTVCLNSTSALEAVGVDGLQLDWSVAGGNGTISAGQGTPSISVFWNVAGSQQVVLNVCGQTITKNIVVLPAPMPVVLAPSAICAGGMNIVSAAGAFDQYSWQTLSGAELGTLPSIDLGPGNYLLTVTDPYGCTGSVPFSINTSPQPNISISTNDPTAFCNNSQTVTMQALISNGGGYTYAWYKDGVNLGVSTPVYSTNQYGSYTLIATNANGCTASAGPIVLVQDCTPGGGGGGFPGAGPPPCPPGAISLLNVTTAVCDSFQFSVAGADYLAGSANWYFGQSGAGLSGTASGDAVGFNYANAGNYITTLVAQLTTGAFCLVVDSLVVEAAAQFDTIPGCAGSATQFFDIGTYMPGSGISAFSWNFGDPASGAANSSPNPNENHIYSNGGVYGVSLTITANSGCTSQVGMPVAISDGTPVNFALPSITCVGSSLPFIAAPGSNVISLDWGFGDPASGAANIAQGDTVFHAFGTGTFTITLFSTDAMGCIASTTQTLVTMPNSLSGNISPASVTPPCEGQPVTFTAPAGAVGYVWSDNSVAQDLMVSTAGVYSVTMTDASGCTYAPPPVLLEYVEGPNVIIKAALTNGLGQLIGYSYPNVSVCDGEEIKLITQGNGSFTYTWSNGTTQSGIVFDEGHNNLLAVGTYTYTVTVTDVATGCTAIADPFVVEVNPVPSGLNINLNNIPACAGNTNTINYTGPQPANWQLVWNTGATGPVLNTDVAGVYFIRAINEFGCEAKSSPVTILPGPNAQALPSGCHTRCKPDSLCLPSIPGIVAWQWYQDGNPVPGATSPDFVAQQSGTYWAELTDVFGCMNESGPLVLDLYDGFGTILGSVWSDVNNNGIIDAADTLISGIPVQLLDNGSNIGNTQSGAAGSFAFSNILSQAYAVSIDTALLPSQWDIVIGQDNALLSGCDVFDQVGLLLHFTCQASGSAVQMSGCPGDSVQYNGQWVQVGASQNFNLSTAAGCDSIVTVTVGSLPVSVGSFSTTVCAGEVYTYNGVDIPAGQSQQFTLTNYQGCDSVLTVSVGTLAATSGNFSTAVCAGEVYTYNGVDIPAGQSQQFTLTNYQGCDSVLTVSVGTLAATSGNFSTAVCAGEVYTYNGVDIPAGQSQQFTLTNYQGCDSVLTVSVGTLATTSGNFSTAVCAGEVYTYNGVDIPAGQSQQFTLTNYQGCDSVLTVSVGTLAATSGNFSTAVCAGEVYTYNGVDIPAGQSQQFTLTNYLGCDSVLTVSVGTLAATSGNFSTAVCAGEVYTYNGVDIPAGQSQQFTLTNYQGCDSVLTIAVSALPIYADVADVSICPGSSYTFNGVSLLAGDTMTFHLNTQEGCDSSITIAVLAYPDLTFGLRVIPSCPNITSGTLSVTGVTGGAAPFEYSIDGVDFFASPAFDTLPAGDYTIFVQDANGCLFLKDTVVGASPSLQLVLEDATLPCALDSIRLSPLLAGDTLGVKYNWYNGSKLPSVSVFDAGPIWVEATNNCETVRAEAAVSWAELPNQELVFVPNVFAPASNLPENHHFRPYFADEVVVLRYLMRVYDRWGNFMFETTDLDDAWTGPFRAEDMQPGVYVWYLEADVSFCRRNKQLRLQGDVTIVR
ncbi:MAG: gliding motility-associated C-terminal domain-containing protein [Lewinellaceae bacterium]|nr:gliding motility-associated C-terminal domain-containing protein [Lewinellaceae bacterium]